MCGSGFGFPARSQTNSTFMFLSRSRCLHTTHAARALLLPQLLQTRDERLVHRCESKRDKRLAVLISAATVLRLHQPRARKQFRREDQNPPSLRAETQTRCHKRCRWLRPRSNEPQDRQSSFRLWLTYVRIVLRKSPKPP